MLQAWWAAAAAKFYPFAAWPFGNPGEVAALLGSLGRRTTAATWRQLSVADTKGEPSRGDTEGLSQSLDDLDAGLSAVLNVGYGAGAEIDESG